MARPATGQVVIREHADRRVFALRFGAYGQRQYVTLGSPQEGWTKAKAELELQNVLADVRRGIWQPPASSPEPAAAPDMTTFHEFSSAWFEQIKPSLRAATVEDYAWALSYHLLPFFHRHRLAQITVAEVDRYRAHKLREGRLSPTSINKTLTRLGQILDVAEERDLIPRNPMRVNRQRRKLRAPAPQRSYLDAAEHIDALLQAAAALDREARAGQSTHRHAILATLIFAGLRIGELLDLRWEDVDLALGRLRVGHSKTAAGVREIDLLPVLREELSVLKAQRHPSGGDLVFGTSRGRRQNPTNVRQRALHRAIERANATLDRDDAGALPPSLTLHSLRRTYASLLFALGRTAPEVMEQIGHADPRVTLRIYARTMRRDATEQAQLRALVQGQSLGTKRHWAIEMPNSFASRTPILEPETALEQALPAMEPTGIEPVTSCLQSRRSPS